MVEGARTTFEDLLSSQDIWTDYADFCSNMPRILAKEVSDNTARESKLIEDLKKSPEFKELTIRDVKPRLKEAEDLLTGGNVMGIDGTMAKYQLMSGTRCQIGVVAVNYQGEHIKHSFFISQSNIREEPEEVLERIFKRASNDENLSDMHLRGLMLYRERDAGMIEQFDQKYIMYHGPLLPFELMQGLGRLRALDTTLALLRKMVNSKRIMSIISTSSFKDLTYFGLALENGQYLTHPQWNVEYHLSTRSDFLKSGEKWREDEKRKVENFIKDFASQIQIGVIKMSDRPYVFQSHKSIFDLSAAIIARDSLFQKEKGFPLLIDYADNLCSEHFSASQFNRMMEWELARNSIYLRESGERRMRAK